MSYYFIPPTVIPVDGIWSSITTYGYNSNCSPATIFCECVSNGQFQGYTGVVFGQSNAVTCTQHFPACNGDFVINQMPPFWEENLLVNINTTQCVQQYTTFGGHS